MRFIKILLACCVALIVTSCGGGAGSGADAARSLHSSVIKPVFAAWVAPGWWWNPDESGSGYAIEQQGTQIFMAAFLYDTNGAATWYVATLNQQPDNTFVGVLTRYQGGQSLLGSYKSPVSAPVANVTLAFYNTASGAMEITPINSTSTRSIQLTRFAIAGSVGVQTPSASFQTGWWWNADEPGRGYFIEDQGYADFIGSFMYDDNGKPTWYVTKSNTMDGFTVKGSLDQYSNGQSLMAPWQAANLISPNSGNATFTLSSPMAGILTLPNGKSMVLRRFNFNQNVQDPPAKPLKLGALLNCTLMQGTHNEAVISWCTAGASASGFSSSGESCSLSYGWDSITLKSPSYAATYTGPFSTSTNGMVFNFSDWAWGVGTYYQLSVTGPYSSLTLTMPTGSATLTATTNTQFGPYYGAAGTAPTTPVGSLTCTFSVPL